MIDSQVAAVLMAFTFIGGACWGGLWAGQRYQRELKELQDRIGYTKNWRKPGQIIIGRENLRGMYLAVLDSPNHEMTPENEQIILNALQKAEEELSGPQLERKWREGQEYLESIGRG